MAMASGFFGITLRDALDASALAVNVEADTFKNVLVADGYTPNFDTHDFYADITNELANGNGYTSGGKAITTPTLVASGGYLTFDADDTSWTAMTKTGIRGRVLDDDTLASDPLLIATTFGADYAVTAGTFTIQESANGLWRVDYIP